MSKEKHTHLHDQKTDQSFVFHSGFLKQITSLGNNTYLQDMGFTSACLKSTFIAINHPTLISRSFGCLIVCCCLLLRREDCLLLKRFYFYRLEILLSTGLTNAIKNVWNLMWMSPIPDCPRLTCLTPVFATESWFLK